MATSCIPIPSSDDGETLPERATLLSDEQIADGRSQWQYEAGGFDAGVRACEDALSTKITSGELIPRSEVEKAIAHEHAEYAKLQSAYLELKTLIEDLKTIEY